MKSYSVDLREKILRTHLIEKRGDPTTPSMIDSIIAVAIHLIHPQNF